MQYVLPFNEHIELQDIKNVTNVELQIENLSCNVNDLSGNIYVVGNYVTNTQESRGFRHEIPMSFIVDTTRKSPEINIKKFDYKVSEGKSLEIIIELEINLEENMDFQEENTLNAYQNEIEEKIDNYVQQREGEEETADILSYDSSQEVNSNNVQQETVCREDDIKELEEAVNDLMDITDGKTEEVDVKREEEDEEIKNREDEKVVEIEDSDLTIDEVDSTTLDEVKENEEVEELFGEVELVNEEEVEPFVILEHHNNDNGESIFRNFENKYDTLTVHHIKEDETIEDIARKYNLSVDYVRELASNPLYLCEGKLSIPINSD